MAVYLLHFSRPIHPDRPCQHYLGYSEDVARRVTEHKSGKGARLCEVAKQRGIDMKLVRVWWDGDRNLERQLKSRKNGRHLCPICCPDQKAK